MPNAATCGIHICHATLSIAVMQGRSIVRFVSCIPIYTVIPEYPVISTRAADHLQACIAFPLVHPSPAGLGHAGQFLGPSIVSAADRLAEFILSFFPIICNFKIGNHNVKSIHVSAQSLTGCEAGLRRRKASAEIH